ncbi:hypothetical protein [Desmospora profundinema]|uniref:Uncharacterized protein n=1 Tax=Desmospora profundinema TaxID=1571184 RepID=A0ABU1IQH0_9BACL|nr:hypothetical protein [Desmospora profundinema]MDR6227010.1 hypothetical protein [Desmospora profundinema]
MFELLNTLGLDPALVEHIIALLRQGISSLPVPSWAKPIILFLYQTFGEGAVRNF